MFTILVRKASTEDAASIRQIYAPDEYLDKNSIEFHRHLGFSLAGTFHHCANKFGRWYNMVYMEKFIGEHSTPPKEVIFSNRE